MEHTYLVILDIDIIWIYLWLPARVYWQQKADRREFSSDDFGGQNSQHFLAPLCHPLHQLLQSLQRWLEM